MYKDKIDMILADIQQRPSKTELSVAELQKIKELNYSSIKDSKEAKDLILKYCKDRLFQNRICEKSYIITTLLPLIANDNDISSIKYGVTALAYLSENEETHEKIVKSQCNLNLKNIITNFREYDIFELCFKIFSNLTKNVKYHKYFLKTRILNDML